MEVRCKNKQIEKIVNSPKKARAKLGDVAAKHLGLLINFLEEVEDMGSIIRNPPPHKYNFHALSGNRKGQYALDIGNHHGSYRLIVCFDVNVDADTIFQSPRMVKVMEIEEVSSQHYE